MGDGSVRPGLDRQKIVLAFAAFWGPFVLMCWPGSMTYDSGIGICQFLQLVNVTPNNPFFQDLVMGIFYTVGKWLGGPGAGIAAYCLIQTALELLLLTAAVHDAASDSQAAGWGLLAVYCIVPVFPLFAFSMSKDASFALAVMTYTLYSLRAIRDPAFWGKRRSVWMLCLSIVAMSLLRNHAGWIPAIAFVLYAVTAVRDRKVIRASALVTAGVCLTSFLPALIGLPAPETRENLSVPLQTLSVYVQKHPEDITEEDREIIARVIDPGALVEQYNPENADPLKNIAVFDGSTTGPFLGLWLRKCLKHPLTMLEAHFRSTDKYLVPTAVCTIKPHAPVGYDLSVFAQEHLGLQNTNSNLPAVLSYVAGWLKTPVLELLVKIGLYTLLLVGMTAAALCLRMPRYLFCLAPLLMILIGCLFSPVNGYYRYAYSMIASLPIVLTDLIRSVRGRWPGRKRNGKARPADEGREGVQ